MVEIAASVIIISLACNHFPLNSFFLQCVVPPLILYLQELLDQKVISPLLYCAPWHASSGNAPVLTALPLSVTMAAVSCPAAQGLGSQTALFSLSICPVLTSHLVRRRNAQTKSFHNALFSGDFFPRRETYALMKACRPVWRYYYYYY